MTSSYGWITYAALGAMFVSIAFLFDEAIVRGLFLLAAGAFFLAAALDYRKRKRE